MPSDPELVTLRKLAESLAKGRKERVTSAHLLAAMVSEPSSAADLLLDLGLTDDRLLSAARASTDELDDPLRRAGQRAREVAARTRAPEPLSVHLLVALLSESGFAARKALEQCGVDVAKLRLRAMNVGLGLVGRRRIVSRRETDAVGRQATASKRSGVAIPIFPPPERHAVEPEPDEPSAPSAPSGEEALAEAQEVKVSAKGPSVRRARPSAAARFDLEPKRYPTLVELGRNLTLAAATGTLEPVVGREKEIELALDVLAKRQGNNPVLVGAAGVGKTSVVRGMALRIAGAQDVVSLDDRILVEIPVSDLIAGTGVRGALAQRMAMIRKEVAQSEGRVVVFFDEVHQLFSGDAAEELSGELKVALAKGELPCIGATTAEELKKVFDADPALARRFSTIEIDEPSREDAYLVLDALAPALSEHHGVAYEEEALALAVAWSVRYLPGRALPDKAVSIVDLAGARVRRRGGSVVDPESVAEVVADAADVPVERLLETDRDRMLGLEELLADRVIGHERPLRRIARILRRNAAGLGGSRPIGTFLLLGPTGVGKTETAKAIAEALFFSESAMTRIDLSEFSEAHSVSRLIGAPPGYVGHEAGGQLTEAVRRRPYQVVLLDEIEKAHPEVLETFLAVFDEGRLTDGRGRTVDFTNAVIVMTSNIGADEATPQKRRVGFGADDAPADEVEDRIVAAARKTLAPEMYNRIDETLVFTPLDREAVRQIARRLLDDVSRRLTEARGATLRVEPAAIERLLDAGGFDPSLGARPMKRAIARLVEAPLAERILVGDVGVGDVVRVVAGSDGVDLEVAGRSGAAAE